MAKPTTTQKSKSAQSSPRKKVVSKSSSATRKTTTTTKRKPVARKRNTKVKASAWATLKYEVYGIILITFSVIALSRQAAVGEFLHYITAFILGKVYFVLPLVGIYIGLAIMLRRKWPRGWNGRLSGLVLLTCAATLISILTYVPVEQLTSLPARQAAGGYIGAVQMWLFMMLFGVIGTKLIATVMVIISLMLITQLSVADLVQRIRGYVKQLSAWGQEKLELMQIAKAERQEERELQAAEAAEMEAYEDELEEEEQDSKRSASGLFPWSRKRNRQAEQDEENPYAAIDAQFEKEELTPASVVTAMPTRSKSRVSPKAGLTEPTNILSSPAIATTPESDLWDNADAEGQVDEKPPIIRDFFAQMQYERGEHNEEDTHSENIGTDASTTDIEAEALTAILHADSNETNGTPLQVVEEDITHTDEESMSSENNQAGEGHPHSNSGSVVEGGTLIPPPVPQPKPYKLPSFALLAKPKNISTANDQNDYMVIARKLETTLESFGVRAKVVEVVRGPAVTRYELQPDVGVKVSRIVGLTDDIALALAAKDIRMEAPIPGKAAVGIEVPNNEVAMVTMREVMETSIFKESEAKLSIAFGRDIAGQTIVGNLAKMPHLLVAGATGSGKSVCINGIITSILYKAKPDEVKFLMVDPKMVELNIYNGIPHLLAPVVTDPKRASLALKKIVVEMEKRYELFSKSGTRNMEGYNNLMKDNPAAVLPYIVVIVDELADLMMVAAGDVEDAIARLAQMARAAGIHLIIATQRPSVDVITGVIKANIPSRIAFGVSSQIDSRTILDMGGAEKLLGRGDMLFMPVGSSKPTRVQGAFMSDEEVEAIVSYCRGQGDAQYVEDLVPEIDDTVNNIDEQLDELYDQAVQIVVEGKQASVSLLQRRMRVGYTRAARLIDSLEAHGIVGPYEGSKPREVLITVEQYQQKLASNS
ncbi:DNA translocase FtsK 4TM domain-containing protein [Paenibacillus kyungheensis]